MDRMTSPGVLHAIPHRERQLLPSPARQAFILLALLFLLPIRPALGEAVQATMPNGLLANASYLEGEPGRPAVLILHGFLQTQDFPTVRRLADSLNEELGYPVLTPTLTLGISDRRSSLACEAVQRHDMEEAVSEIGAWVNWLKERGHRRIVLIGHSTGSVMIAAYLPRAAPEVKHTILISLTHFGPGQAVFRDEANGGVQRARKIVEERGGKELGNFPIAYCRRYVTTAEKILGYYAWDEARVLEALAHSPVPMTAIIGSEDHRMGTAWTSAIGRTPNVEVRIIEGADHFFDAEHEFSLLDAIDELLQRVTDGR